MFPAGQLFHEQVSDAMWLANGPVFVMKLELKLTLKTTGIKSIVVSNKSNARPKRQNEAISPFGRRD